MPRRNRPKREGPRPVSHTVSTTPIPAPAGWHAQGHRGGEPGRTYKCPHCHRDFAANVDHVVAWNDDSDRRRHWHRACWERALREGIDRYRWT